MLRPSLRNKSSHWLSLGDFWFEGVSMRASLMAVLALFACTGCTSLALDRYTVTQSMSVSDMRNIAKCSMRSAVVANNSGSLPSMAMTKSGQTNVTNTVNIDTTTLWDANVRGFSKETFTAFAQHNPDLQWTLDPVVTAPQLEALYLACIWAVGRAE